MSKREAIETASSAIEVADRSDRRSDQLIGRLLAPVTFCVGVQSISPAPMHEMHGMQGPCNPNARSPDAIRIFLLKTGRLHGFATFCVVFETIQAII